MNHLKILFSILLLCLVSCTKDTSPTSSIPKDAFQYQAFDSTGTIVVDGWLKFKVNPSLSPAEEMSYLAISGEWHFSKIGNPVNIGHQVGDEILKGTIEDDQIWINLNPGIADDNVVLNGKINGRIIEGHWYYSIFVGAINGGSFKAEKQ